MAEGDQLIRCEPQRTGIAELPAETRVEIAFKSCGLYALGLLAFRSHGLRVAVVTAYFKEATELLRQAHDSVMAQSYPATHFMVADGHPNDSVRTWGAQHIVLPINHDDHGDTPRVLGAISALSLGYDAVTFLDADNWYLTHHIATMVQAHRESGRNVCLASRAIHRLDGSFMYNMREDDRHADTSCIFLVGEATRLIPLMAIKPKPLSEIGDRIFWKCLRERRAPFVRVTVPTVAYAVLGRPATSWLVRLLRLAQRMLSGSTLEIGLIEPQKKTRRRGAHFSSVRLIGGKGREPPRKRRRGPSLVRARSPRPRPGSRSAW